MTKRTEFLKQFVANCRDHNIQINSLQADCFLFGGPQYLIPPVLTDLGSETFDDLEQMGLLTAEQRQTAWELCDE